MAKHSAGLLVYRPSSQGVEVLLVHPGGPFWAKKDAGVWSIPKGEFEEGEDPLTAARREFREETGQPAPSGEAVELGSVKLSSGKVIRAWAIEGDVDISNFISNTFTMEWPPKSGQQQEFPENDRGAWVLLATAKEKLNKAQTVFIDRLAAHLKLEISEPAPKPEQTLLL